MRIVNIGFDRKYLEEIKKDMIKNIEGSTIFTDLDEFNLTFKDQEEIDQYNKRLQLQQRDNALKLLAIERKCPGSLPASEVAKHHETIRMTDGICSEEISNSLNEINKEFWNIYDTEFRPLLQLKGTTFESIYMQIQANADAILSFWRK